MVWKSKKWGLSTYISLILDISIIRKIVGIRLFLYFPKINERYIAFYYFSYDHKYILSKVHIKWQITSLYHFFTDQFQIIIPISISF